MRGLMLVLACLGCHACGSAGVWAQTQFQLVGTELVKTPGMSFQMQCSTLPVQSTGYRLVRFDFTPRRAVFAQDQRLHVVVSPTCSRPNLEFDFHQDVELTKGSSSAHADLYVPCYANWNQLHVQLSSGDDTITPNTFTYPLSGPDWWTVEGSPRVVGIIVAQDAMDQDAPWKACPDIRGLASDFGSVRLQSSTRFPRLNHNDAMSTIFQINSNRHRSSQSLSFGTFQEQRLPGSWLAYSPCDVLIVAAPVLQRMEKQRPDESAAIWDWVETGGALWVYALDDAESYVPKPLHTASGKTLPPNENGKEFGGVYTLHPFGMGRVVQISASDPFPGSNAGWSRIFSRCGIFAHTHCRRVGVSMNDDSFAYYQWLIRSVGQPPVLTFLFLNAVFVVLIGPVSYGFLQRRGRLPLFYFVIPAMALFAISSLFLWGIVSEGLGTKVRATQITWFDKQRDRSFTQARQTYYSSLGNRRRGLVFPTDAAVYPVLPDEPSRRARTRRTGQSERPENLSRSVVVNADGQSFRGQFLPVRTQAQFLLTYPRRDSMGPSFAVDGSAVTVTNHHNGRLSVIYYKGRGAKYHRAEDIAPGQTKPMQPTSMGDVRSWFGQQPWAESLTYDLRPKNIRDKWGRRSSVDLDPATVRKCALEDALVKSWPPNGVEGSFVGLTEIDASLIGVQGAALSDSVHLVLGVAK